MQSLFVKMARREYVKGYEQFRRLTAQFEGDSKSKMVIYFMGDRNDGGISWCPDCAKGELYFSLVEIS